MITVTRGVVLRGASRESPHVGIGVSIYKIYFVSSLYFADKFKFTSLPTMTSFPKEIPKYDGPGKDHFHSQ